jgi:hypothetical protein
MMRHIFTVPCVLALLVGCGSESGARSAEEVPGPSDTEFSAIQERGRIAMGVDQYTSAHRFDVLADGGRIELQRDVQDPAGVATIRQHLQEITAAFQAGDFRIPGFVHDTGGPGHGGDGAEEGAYPLHVLGAAARGAGAVHHDG